MFKIGDLVKISNMEEFFSDLQGYGIIRREMEGNLFIIRCVCVLCEPDEISGGVGTLFHIDLALYGKELEHV